MKATWYISILLSLYGSVLVGQDFSYFTLGSDELSDAEIYNVLPLSDGRLYVSTNQGLYTYRQGRMQVVPSAEGVAPQGALFSLTANSRGIVHGVDLAGGVFTLQRDSLRKVVQIPKSYLNAEVFLQFDGADQLFFLSQACLLLTVDTFRVLSAEEEPTNALCQLPDGRLSASFQTRQRLAIVQGDSLSPLPYPIPATCDPRGPLLLDSNLLVMDPTRHAAFDLKRQRYLPIQGDLPTRSSRQLTTDEAWVLYPDFGLASVRLRNDTIQVSERKIPLQFISCIAELDGTLFLGTFGAGVLVVPNKRVIRHPIGADFRQLLDVAVSPGDTVFFVDKSRGIHRYWQGENQFLRTTPSGGDRLFYFPDYRGGWLPDYPSLYFQNTLPWGADKDATLIDEETLLIAASTCVKRYGPDTTFRAPTWLRDEQLAQLYVFQPLQERCVSIAYDTVQKHCYLATLTGVYRIDQQGKLTPLVWHQRPILAHQLRFYNGLLYIASQAHGLLRYDGKKVTTFLNKTNGLRSNTVQQITLVNDHLYLSGRQGFQLIDLATRTITDLGIADGLVSSSIKDFAVSDRNLWFIANNQLLSIGLAEL
ncbi:MAG: hypothetical protein AAGJ82_04545, partial [Bacteroidota bacterium]